MLINEDKLLTILNKTINYYGYKLVDLIFFNNSSEKKIRLYIFSEQGIEIGDCEKVNNFVLETIKNQGISEEYILEVSSPGIFMELKKPEHFQIFKGKRIKVKLFKSIKGNKIAIGNILNCNDNGIDLKIKDKKEKFHIPFSYISNANLEPELNI